MLATITKKETVEVKYIVIDVPVRYDDKDIPYDFPFRKGGAWRITVDIDTGRIHGWPEGYAACNVHMKVCDEGVYTLLAPDQTVVAKLEQEYVPRGIVPGEYGDYINLHINEDGFITNWNDRKSLCDWLEVDDADEEEPT